MIFFQNLDAKKNQVENFWNLTTWYCSKSRFIHEYEIFDVNLTTLTSKKFRYFLIFIYYKNIIKYYNNYKKEQETKKWKKYKKMKRY